MLNKNKKSLQWIIYFIGILLLLVILYILRSVFIPILAAYLIAFTLNPSISFFERLGLKRIKVICGFYIFLSLFILGSLFLIIPTVGYEFQGLYLSAFIGDRYDDLNSNRIYDKGEPLVNDINKNKKYDESYILKGKKIVKKTLFSWNKSNPKMRINIDNIYEELKNEVAEKKQYYTSKFTDYFASILGYFIYGINGIFIFLSLVILIPLYSFFFLLGFNNYENRLVNYLPRKERFKIMQILKKIGATMGSFFRGKLIICFIKAIITLLGLWIFGVKFAFIFAIIQFFCSFIPFIVIIFGMLPAFLVVLLDVGFNWGMLLGVFATFTITEIIEGFILTPLILSKETELHPVVVIIALLAGSSLLGLLGALIAVPCAAIIKIVWQEVISNHIKKLADDI